MKVFQNMRQSAQKLRGIIINHAIEIESIVEIWIADYFTKEENKLDEIVCVIFPRLTFDSKKQIFVYLLDKYVPDFKVKHPQYSKDLDEIIELRNIIAHYPLEYSEFARKSFTDLNSLNFVKMKNTKEKHRQHDLFNRIVISEKKAQEHCDLMNHMTDILKPLLPSTWQTSTPDS